ncbi:MAG TPA: hypothetical protein VFB25_02020 [Gaiellaceae bacterium]|nr:hypothetical protein [Gaiellaceae bacterium]
MSQPDRLDPQTDAASVAAVSEVLPSFTSILGSGAQTPDKDTPEPACFRDLNLDQVVAEIVRSRGEYELEPFFRTPLHDPETVAFRHEVFRDLEVGELRVRLTRFAEQMHQTRVYLNLVQGQRFRYEKERWFLDAVELYCDAVEGLADALDQANLASVGFQALRQYLAAYTGSESFLALVDDQKRVRAGLDGVRYSLAIKGTRITVSPYENEPDYSADVEDTFMRFRQGAVESHLIRIPDPNSMDHVEAQVVERVAKLNPNEFRALDEFCSTHAGFLNEAIVRFDQEAQFYLSYLDYVDGLGGTGASFCLPAIGDGSKLDVKSGCDIALAGKLVGRHHAIVQNDFALRQPERIIVVGGPNQGGKTTFSRMFGQLHYLAALGVPVPAAEATLFLPDEVFAHFERQEDISTLRGKLDDELVRIKEILDRATRESVIVVNEIFASTTLDDAVTLGTKVLRRVIQIGCVALFVTFVDELSSLGPETVSMVATVDPADPARRTFKVVRKPADGRAYALAIANKYGLTYDKLRARVGE